MLNSKFYSGRKVIVLKVTFCFFILSKHILMLYYVNHNYEVFVILSDIHIFSQICNTYELNVYLKNCLSNHKACYIN